MDTIRVIKCPACGKKMEKVFIPSEGINIDICLNGCGGIFFDNREFDKFNEIHEDISLIEEKYADKKFESVDEKAIRICPTCGTKMVKNPSAVGAKIIVDNCYVCGAKFLDYGELEEIRKEYENDVLRREATIEYLFSKVGAELHQLDVEVEERKANRDLSQKLFYALLNMKK